MSYDKTLVVKLISSEDVADMHSLLSHYHQVRVAARRGSFHGQVRGSVLERESKFCYKKSSILQSE